MCEGFQDAEDAGECIEDVREGFEDASDAGESVEDDGVKGLRNAGGRGPTNSDRSENIFGREVYGPYR